MIKKGDYIRAYNGFIGKLEYIDPIGIDYNHYHFENSFEELYDDDIKLVKEGLIDLIEEGDYVNGFKVLKILSHSSQLIFVTYKYNGHNYTKILNNEDIKSIVTKEQFENIEYRIGE